MVRRRSPQQRKRRMKKEWGRGDLAEVRCPTGKVSYRSYAAAERAMQKIAEEPDPQRDKPIRAYVCEVCGKFHTTKHAQRSRR